MHYTLTQTDDCELQLCNTHESNGYISIPSALTGAILINYIDIKLSPSCEEGEDIIDFRILPLPLGLDVDIICQDDNGPRYAVSYNVTSGPNVPSGTTFDWYFYYNSNLLYTFLNNSSPSWIMPQEINKIKLVLTLSNGVIVTYEREPNTTVPEVDGCYTYVFDPAVITLSAGDNNFTFNDDYSCMVIAKPADGIYTWETTINYNTSLLNNQSVVQSECMAVLCDTECDVAKYTAENLCTDLFLLQNAISSAIDCQRCEDACTVFDYVSQKLDNDKDCECYGSTEDCC